MQKTTKYGIAEQTKKNAIVALEKYSLPLKGYHGSGLQATTNVLKKYLKRTIGTVEVQDWQTVFADTDWSTGPGFPYGSEGITKADFFVGTFDCHRDVVSKLEAYERALMFGPTYPTPVYTAAYKDEVLATEKIEKNKTRLFMPSSFPYTLLCSKYFGDFAKRFYKCAKMSTTNFWPGKVEQIHFAELYEQVSKFQLALHADMGSWDKTVLDTIMACIYEAMLECYPLEFSANTPENTIFSRLACDNIFKNVALWDGTLIYLTGKQASGHVLTIVLNSLMILFLLLLACHDLGYSAEKFLNETYWMIGGDDNFIAFNKEWSPFFQQLPDYLASIGYIYETEGIQTPKEINFLSASIGVIDTPSEQFIGPRRDYQRLVATCQFTKHPKDPSVAHMKALSALLAAVPIGRDEFSRIAGYVHWLRQRYPVQLRRSSKTLYELPLDYDQLASSYASVDDWVYRSVLHEIVHFDVGFDQQNNAQQINATWKV